MKYGLPYKGSKNKLAERIVSLLPKRTHLIDLFCGGCAVSHAALLRNKYEHIHINDINWMCPTLFIDALNGKYQNETRWISREDFFRLKDTDPYVAVVWSFGNNMQNYLYSKEIEPLKKAIHYAIFFRDYSLGKDLGYDLSFIDPICDIQRRYAAVKRYFSQFGHFQQQSFEGGGQRVATNCKLNTSRGGAESSRLQSTEAYERLNTNLQSYGGGETYQSDWKQSRGLQTSIRTSTSRMPQPSLWDSKKNRQGELCNGERANCIAQIAIQGATTIPTEKIGGGDFQNITSSVLDYAKVEIPKDSVIYCDIPYEGTDGYLEKDSGGFDYERFYDWCEHQTQPVFISSYQMPDDRFDCIEEFSHRSTLSATANNLVTERIYVPKHQKERGNRAIQLSLF